MLAGTIHVFLTQASHLQVDAEIKAAKESLLLQYEEKIKSLNAEWRAKCISLAQRLDKTEKELEYARPQDIESIQVRRVCSASHAARALFGCSAHV